MIYMYSPTGQEGRMNASTCYRTLITFCILVFILLLARDTSSTGWPLVSHVSTLQIGDAPFMTHPTQSASSATSD